MQLHDNILNNLNNNCANLGLLVTIQDNNNHDNKLYLTNLDNDIISNNQIYCSGIVLNNINFNNFINRNNKAFVLNVKKNLLNTMFDNNLLNSLITVYIFDQSNSNNVNILYNGFILNYIDKFDDIIRLYVAPITTKLNQNIGDFFSANCRAMLGDFKCKIDLNRFGVKGSIVSILSNNSFIGNHVKQISGYFNFGTIVFTSGINDGVKFHIQDNGNDVMLILFRNIVLKLNDTYIVYPGCDKTLNTCNNKFSNVVNFHGEPFIS